MASGIFITLEGIEGSGKTTLVNMLQERLIIPGRDIIYSREPGGTAIAERIRSLITAHDNKDMQPMTELLLMYASRAEHIANCIKPMLSGNPTIAQRSPVLNAPIISGMVPCNIVAEEILADHPARYRAMIVESANPAHSTADTKKFLKAMGRLDCSIVIDIAMTETAKHADYVLPTTTQYEKAEATFFNFDLISSDLSLSDSILTKFTLILLEIPP